MLYANLFWTWGHPEVYILILPAFGVFSEVVGHVSRANRLFGYKSMVYATAVIMILSFSVWMHHFFHNGRQSEREPLFRDCNHADCNPHGRKDLQLAFHHVSRSHNDLLRRCTGLWGSS